jgi:hypothetical protein
VIAPVGGRRGVAGLGQDERLELLEHHAVYIQVTIITIIIIIILILGCT